MCETLYSDEFMINRLLDTIEGNKTEKMVIDEPVISRKNKRTIIENFGAICFKVNRDIDIVDMGVPLFNMHAPLEIASKADLYSSYLAYKEFFSS